jgi:hypothetical protein
VKAAAAILIAGVLAAQADPPAVNRDTAIVNEFEKRVDSYLKLRRDIEAEMGRLRTTQSQEKISHHEGDLRHKLRETRTGAREGDIFTPEISMEIRRLIGLAMQPADADHIKQSLRRSEPVELHLKVNDKYPEQVPLQTTPPTLLGNLPKLPPEIEYRITGRDLVLLDAKADLVIDVLRGVFS